MKSNQSLNDLQRLTIAKHGEDWAWAQAHSGKYGAANHIATWQKILALPEQLPGQVLNHQQWQRDIQTRFFGRTFEEGDRNV